jgi:DNA-binding GntR family transcriptional regulator
LLSTINDALLRGLMPRTPSLERLTDRSLTDQAYSAIRDSILDGRFGLGERIVEYKVAEDLGISRAPVREALRRLVEEQLVTERPRYGTFVREITAQDFVDIYIYNARIAIETAAIRLAARTQPELTAIEKTIDEMASAARRKQASRVVNLELQVHQQLCDVAGNPFLSSAFHSLSGPIRLALGLDDEGYPDLQDVAAEHPPLLDAIRSGDERKAARTIHEHIVASIEPVLERLNGSREGVLDFV